MGFSPKEIKKAQKYAEKIAKEKEAKYAEEHKNDKVISDNRSARDRLTTNFLLQATMKKLADDGDEYAKEVVNVSEMMAEDMMDNLQRSFGGTAPERERSEEDQYKILFYKIRMPQNQKYLMEALLRGDGKVISFMTQMRMGRLPSNEAIEYIQSVIHKLAKQDEEKENV